MDLRINKYIKLINYLFLNKTMIIDEENNNIFIIEKLQDLKKELDKDSIDLRTVKQDIKQISQFDNAKNYEYLNNLLYPIKKKGVKIPSQIPVPTCSFQLHNFLTYKVNDAGFDVFGMNPWFLAADTIIGTPIVVKNIECHINKDVGMYFYCNSPNLDGTTEQPDFFFPGSFSQTIPYVYEKYRLVSACVEVRYIGQIDQASGVIGGGITYTKSDSLGAKYIIITSQNEYPTRNKYYGPYGNFELIRDSFYHSENLCLEGLRMLYFPLDNSFNEFKKILKDYSGFKNVGIYQSSLGALATIEIKDDYFKSGFNWFVYQQGSPISETRNFRVDYYLNYECIPRAEFLNYMPISIDLRPNISEELRKKFIEEVQGQAIQKINN